MLLIKTRARRDIDLASDDRLDAVLFRTFIEIDSAKHHAMVRNGHGALSKRLNTLDQPFDAARAVKQAVFRMHVQMCKICHNRT